MKKICQSLGGEVVVSSTPNVGSTFKATMKVYSVNKLIGRTKQRKKLDKNDGELPVAREDGNGGRMIMEEDLEES